MAVAGGKAPHADEILGKIEILIGVTFLVSWPWAVPYSLTLVFSRKDLEAVSGPRYRLVKWMTVAGRVWYVILGAWFLFGGISGLTGH